MKNIQQKRISSHNTLVRLISGLTAIAACCLLVRAASGEESQIIAGDNSIFSSAAKELTGICSDNKSDTPISLTALMAQSSVLRQYADAVPGEVEKQNNVSSIKGTLYYDPPASERNASASTQDKSEKTYSVAEYVKDPSLVKIKNNSGLEIDVESLLKEELNIPLSDDGPAVLVIHTHGSEAYTPDGTDTYEVSDTYRTEDPEKSVISLGTILSDELNRRGIYTIHDTGIYDYPSYAGSYNRTCDVIMDYLDKYPSISIVIDLHRDASEVNGSLDYKTTAKINGETCSQVMLVVGTDSSGLDHPDWHENLKFAMNLQCAAESRYPTLTRPIAISKNRYNQHATPGSLILEVGYCGNTLDESRKAVYLFADAAADVILPILQKH